MPDAILNNGIFSCFHLSPEDERDIRNFTVRAGEGGGLARYLQFHALQDEELGDMRTYIVRDSDTSELAGYFSLKAGFVSYNEREIAGKTAFDSMPGVELANFAMNDGYVREHPRLKGAGFMIFTDFIQPIVKKVAQDIGVRVIYIFALNHPTLLQQYQASYGFLRLSEDSEAKLHSRLKPSYDEGCIFMFQMLQEV